MISKTLERPPEVKDDILWDLLTKMLAFDRKDRISASDALNHEFFTSDKVLNEISKEVRNIALAAQTSKNKGNHYVTQYDTNSLFIIPLRKIKQILSDDPESVVSPQLQFNPNLIWILLLIYLVPQFPWIRKCNAKICLYK
ncbi:MAG: hypothetical protein EZS28_045255 [Streblomastix strix]|uniref:Protein kinase domain-containing protein n=1 Tax=Streblomastix strix TaxID=222440 RepID=A0A5J4TLN1_9EUKA|nr:MAG: hypothetical protein EZS28_045255 [Streblomastix strix]